MSDLYPWLQAPWERFAKLMQTDRLPHALMVKGAAGVGKLEFAQAVALALVCESPKQSALGCGQCKSCQMLKAGTHADWHTVSLEDGSKQIKVDQIREMSRQAYLTTDSGKFRGFILHPADTLNVNASNALLKTLEEPAPNTMIILVAEHPGRLPATVASRCQAVPIATPDSTTCAKWLKQQSGLSEDRAQLLADSVRGGPLEALAMSHDHRFEEFVATANQVQALVKGQLDPILLAQEWAADKDNLSARVRWTLSDLMNLCWRQQGGNYAARLTGEGELDSLLAIIEQGNRIVNLLETSVNAQMLLEQWLLALAKVVQTPRSGTQSALNMQNKRMQGS